MTEQLLGARVEGLAELIETTDPEILAEPLLNFFNAASISVLNNIKPETPVDRGRLRSSMTYIVDSSLIPTWARIGTNVTYAKPVEFGTGKLSEAPDSKRAKYFPPPQALEPWAQRHGFASGYQVARIIFNREGTEPRAMLRTGFEKSIQRINQLLKNAADDVGKKWKI